MGFLTGELGGSHNLSKGTIRAIRNFFVSRRKAPRGWVGPRPSLQTSLLNRFAKAVETETKCKFMLAVNDKT